MLLTNNLIPTPFEVPLSLNKGFPLKISVCPDTKILLLDKSLTFVHFANLT